MSEHKTIVLIELYRIYQAMENFPNVFATIENAYTSTDNDSIKERIYIDKAIMLISKGELQRAEIILTKISAFSNYEKIKRESFYWLGIGQLYSYKWAESKNNMKKFYGRPYNTYIDSIFSNSDKLDLKSPKRARLFSLFLPGLGQIYAKDYKIDRREKILWGRTITISSIIKSRYQKS